MASAERTARPHAAAIFCRPRFPMRPLCLPILLPRVVEISPLAPPNPIRVPSLPGAIVDLHSLAVTIIASDRSVPVSLVRTRRVRVAQPMTRIAANNCGLEFLSLFLPVPMSR